jgi:hypothetical protein
VNDFVASHAAALTGAGIVLAIVLIFGTLAVLDPERLDPRPHHARRRGVARQPLRDPFEVDLGDADDEEVAS